MSEVNLKVDNLSTTLSSESKGIRKVKSQELGIIIRSWVKMIWWDHEYLHVRSNYTPFIITNCFMRLLVDSGFKRETIVKRFEEEVKKESIDVDNIQNRKVLGDLEFFLEQEDKRKKNVAAIQDRIKS